MKQSEYDKRIMQIIKVIREQKYLKQINMAQMLGIDGSTYCRIERGELGYTPWQLRKMAEALNTNHMQIYALVDSEFGGPLHHTSFSLLLIKTILISEGRGSEIEFSDEELDFVLSTIRKKYAEAKLLRSKKKL